MDTEYDFIIITVDGTHADLNRLDFDLRTARDEREGATIRVGGHTYTVDVAGVSRRHGTVRTTGEDDPDRTRDLHGEPIAPEVADEIDRMRRRDTRGEG